jgi:hypothetical protein
MSKHWDYEDDHDWDDEDYAANGYVYWYGKYYPKEDIDALFKNSSDDNNATEGSLPNVLGWIFLAIAGIGATGYGIRKKVMPAIKHKLKKNDEFVEVQ